MVWLLSLFKKIFLFFILIIVKKIILIFFKKFYLFTIIFFFLFFLTFHLSHVADRILVLWPGVRPEPLRWKSQVQDTGPPETSQPHVVSVGKELSPKPPSQCYAKCQTTGKTGTRPHPLAERLPKITLSSQTPQNTPLDVALPTRKTRSRPTHKNTGTSPLHQEAYTTH